MATALPPGAPWPASSHGHGHARGHPDGGPRFPGTSEAVIEMKDGAFHSERVVVPAGTRVMWVNRDPRTHNVVLGFVSSPDLEHHERWSYVFDRPGTTITSGPFTGAWRAAPWSGRRRPERAETGRDPGATALWFAAGTLAWRC